MNAGNPIFNAFAMEQVTPGRARLAVGGDERAVAGRLGHRRDLVRGAPGDARVRRPATPSTSSRSSRCTRSPPCLYWIWFRDVDRRALAARLAAAAERSRLGARLATGCAGGGLRSRTATVSRPRSRPRWRATRRRACAGRQMLASGVCAIASGADGPSGAARRVAPSARGLPPTRLEHLRTGPHEPRIAGPPGRLQPSGTRQRRDQGGLARTGAARPVPRRHRAGRLRAMAEAPVPQRTKTAIPQEPRPARAGHEGHAPVPGQGDRGAVLRAARVHRVPHLLLGAGAPGDLPAGGRGRGRAGVDAAADLQRHRVRARLHHRAHRVHVRAVGRVADAVAPARPPPRGRRVRPAEPALRQVQGRGHDAARDDRGGRPRAARPLRGAGRRRARPVRATWSRPACPARTRGSCSRTRRARTSS